MKDFVLVVDLYTKESICTVGFLIAENLKSFDWCIPLDNISGSDFWYSNGYSNVIVLKLTKLSFSPS